MHDHVFAGFGFGPIQSGLFLNEAFQSGNFSRLVVAEIDQNLVDAVRKNSGSYFVNVAHSDGIEVLEIKNVELLNPKVEKDKAALLEALSQATEIVTSLPSVNFFEAGGENSVAGLIAKGLANSKADGTIIYTAENNNHAAEILQEAVLKFDSSINKEKVQFLNTVIGKMSQVCVGSNDIKKMKLKPMASGIERAFLVEEFNRILVTRATIEGFEPGIEVFLEKDDLLPFEEAKLYGHNAIHAVMSYLADFKGYEKMDQVSSNASIMKICRDAFLNESGQALIKKYKYLGDELFTQAGYKEYAEDLLTRMTNPFLADAVERTGRDIKRKLGSSDRIVGTMRLALEYGIKPENMAIGAMAAITTLLKKAKEYELPDQFVCSKWQDMTDEQIAGILKWIWDGHVDKMTDELIGLVIKARKQLAAL